MRDRALGGYLCRGRRVRFRPPPEFTAVPAVPVQARSYHELSPHPVTSETRHPVSGKRWLAGETAENAEGLSRWQFSTVRIV